MSEENSPLRTPTKPDQTEKLLESWNDVFADIVNVLVYGGKKVLKEENLMDGPTAAQYKAAEGNYNSKDRDICKIDMLDGRPYRIWGLENQTCVDMTMPVRVMGYDYASLERMVRILQERNKEEKLSIPYPQVLAKDQVVPDAVTLVLYFGLKPWDGPKDRWTLCKTPMELRPFVPNYEINLVEVAFLPDDVIEKFSSDFRHIARLFRAKRLGKVKDLRYNRDELDHIEEMLDFLFTFAGDKRYSDIKKDILAQSQKGEKIGMCNILDAVVEEATQPLEEALLQKNEELKLSRYKDANRVMTLLNCTAEKAAESLEFSLDEKVSYLAWRKTLGLN